MEKKIVFMAMSGIGAAVVAGIVIFVRNYARYEKQKNWEDATKRLTPEQLANVGAERGLKETQAKKSERRRWGVYAVIGLAIAVYLACAV